MIATLGSEPQVATAALDLLLAQGEVISRLAVLHTSSPGAPFASAVETLRQAFLLPPYQGRVALELCPILDAQGQPLEDVETPQAAQAAFRELYRLIRAAKHAGLRVHLSIAGGRKTMAVFGMAAAQLLFDENDRLWHLFSAGDFLASKRLHPQAGDEARLISIPLILWSQVSPVLAELSQIEDPYEAVERVRRLQVNERIEQARGFALGSLTPAEQRVVALLVREGLGDMELAGRLGLSPRTVEQHLRSAYQKAAAHWELADVGRNQLMAVMGLYYALK